MEISADEKVYFGALASKLQSVEWTPEKINNVVAEEAKVTPLGSKKGFQALYKILINRTSGPRLGSFLASMDREFVIKRMREASL